MSSREVSGCKPELCTAWRKLDPKLFVAVNKLDDPCILPEDGVWPKLRYDEIVGGLTPFLKQCG